MLGMKTRKKSAMLLLTAVMSISLFGCSTGNTTTGNAAQPAGEGNTAAAETTKPAGGKLVLYSAGPQKLADNIVSGFTDKTGIEVEMFQGTTGKILGSYGSREIQSGCRRCDPGLFTFSTGPESRWTDYALPGTDASMQTS